MVRRDDDGPFLLRQNMMAVHVFTQNIVSLRNEPSSSQYCLSKRTPLRTHVAPAAQQADGVHVGHGPVGNLDTWHSKRGMDPGQFCLDTIRLFVLKAGFQRLWSASPSRIDIFRQQAEAAQRIANNKKAPGTGITFYDEVRLEQFKCV